MTESKLTLEQMREKIGMAIGAASMCWIPIPSGVFDSSKAKEIADDLCLKFEAETARRKSAEEALSFYAQKPIVWDLGTKARQHFYQYKISIYPKEKE